MITTEVTPAVDMFQKPVEASNIASMLAVDGAEPPLTTTLTVAPFNLAYAMSLKNQGALICLPSGF